MFIFTRILRFLALEGKPHAIDLEKVAIEIDIEPLGHMVVESWDMYFVGS